jgi:hypothetical protein
MDTLSAPREAPQRVDRPVAGPSWSDLKSENGTAIPASNRSMDAEGRREAEPRLDTGSRRDTTDRPVDTSKPVNDRRFCSAVRLLGIIYRISLYNRRLSLEELSLGSLNAIRLASTRERYFKGRGTCRLLEPSE